MTQQPVPTQSKRQAQSQIPASTFVKRIEPIKTVPGSDPYFARAINISDHDQVICQAHRVRVGMSEV